MNILGMIGMGARIVDELHTSREEKDAAALEIYKAQTQRMAQDQRIQLAQLEIERAAAKNPRAATWRPMVGKICAFALLYHALAQPILAWLSAILEIPPPPVPDLEFIVPVLFSMLGMAGLRTYEKARGVASGK